MKKKRERENEQRTRKGRDRDNGQREEKKRGAKKGGRQRSGAYSEERDEEALQQRKKNAKRLSKRRESMREERANRKETARGRGANKSPERPEKRRNSKGPAKDRPEKRRDRNAAAKSVDSKSPKRGAKDRAEREKLRAEKPKRESAKPKVETFKRVGGAEYKLKSPKIEEETKEKAEEVPTIAKAAGPRWERKADIEAREELAKKQRQAREQQRTRGMVARIFGKSESGALSEEEVQSAVTKVYKQQLLRRLKRRKNRANRGRGGGRYQVKMLSSEDERVAEEEAKVMSLEVIEAMKHGYLSEEYTVKLDEQFGYRTYRRKSDEEEELYEEMNEEDAVEINEMADRFHANIGHSFGLEEVRAFFKSADGEKVEKLCHDLKHNIFDDLFEATKKTSTGEYVFLRKEAKSDESKEMPTATN